MVNASSYVSIVNKISINVFIAVIFAATAFADEVHTVVGGVGSTKAEAIEAGEKDRAETDGYLRSSEWTFTGDSTVTFGSKCRVSTDSRRTISLSHTLSGTYTVDVFSARSVPQDCLGTIVSHSVSDIEVSFRRNLKIVSETAYQYSIEYQFHVRNDAGDDFRFDFEIYASGKKMKVCNVFPDEGCRTFVKTH